MTNATETERPSPKVIDARTFWRTLGERAIGATIVTAQGADGPAGFLGLSATHVCADPPSMLVSIDRKTSALAAVLHGHHFAINYLGRDARHRRHVRRQDGGQRLSPFRTRSLGHVDHGGAGLQ